MNIIDKTDEEILEIAHPMWNDLIKYSNKGQYGKFIRKFSYDLLLGLNEVEGKAVPQQYQPKKEITGPPHSKQSHGTNRNPFAARPHVTVLYRVRSTKREGEWLGRMVLGYEKGEVRISRRIDFLTA